MKIYRLFKAYFYYFIFDYKSVLDFRKEILENDKKLRKECKQEGMFPMFPAKEREYLVKGRKYKVSIVGKITIFVN